MKVTSGMTHPLVDPQGWRTGPVRTVHCRPPVHPQPAPPAAGPPTASPRATSRLRQAALLCTVASAALLGCSSMTVPTWHMEPAYRVQSAGAEPAQGYLALARQYEGEDRLAQALDAYRKAALTAPWDADMQNTVGLALARQAQYGPAVQALRRAVALAPERAQLINNLGYALLLADRADEARAMFKLTLAVDPMHELASRNLAYVDEQRRAVASAASAAALLPAPRPLVVLPVGPPVSSAEVARSMPQADPLHRPQAPTVVPVAMSASVATAPAPAVHAVGISSAAAVMLARVRLEGVRIEIVNGNGVEGAAARMRLWLRQQGIESGRLVNLLPYSSQSTQVQYRPGNADQAHAVAGRLPIQAQVVPAPDGATRADLRVVIGHDARHAFGCAASSVCAAPGRLVAGSVHPTLDTALR